MKIRCLEVPNNLPLLILTSWVKGTSPFQLEAWTLIIRKSTAILQSPMVLLLLYQIPLLFFLDVSSAILYIPCVHHEFDLNTKPKPIFSSLYGKIDKCSFPSLIEYQCSQWHNTVCFDLFSDSNKCTLMDKILTCWSIYKYINMRHHRHNRWYGLQFGFPLGKHFQICKEELTGPGWSNLFLKRHILQIQCVHIHTYISTGPFSRGFYG